MQTLLHCICLRVVKHSDTTSLATAWSRERGMVVINVPCGQGREARRLRAVMMPFSLFECMATFKPGREVIRVSDVLAVGASPKPSASLPLKSMLGLFLSDVLRTVLRESQPDALMSDFIFESVRLMHESEGVSLANFHLYFIYHLTHFLGISPDVGTYAAGRYFDMREGVFTSTAPMHADALLPEQASMVRVLSRLHSRNLWMLKLSHAQRNAILDRMLEYYSMHHTPLTSLSSLAVLRQVMGN